MADFNPAIMIDVTRPATTLNAVFTGSIASSTGILSVTSYQSGQITSQMTLTTSGFDAVVVTDKLAPEEGEIERWQTHRIYAGIYGSVTNSVLTVDSVWRGSMATLPGTKYLFLTAQPAGSRALAPISVDSNGLGDYSLSVVQGLNVSPRRMIVQYYNTASQAISNATFSGVWEWESVSSVSPTTNQSAFIQHIGLAAQSSVKAVYFPPGRYVGPASIAGVDIYGASSKGPDSQRTVLQDDYTANIWSKDFYNPKSLTDIRTEGLRINLCDKVKGCYLWMPDNITAFTGRVEGTTLTVEALPANGFVTVGSVLKQGNTTLGTITALLSGAPNVAGCTFTVSASQSVATGTSLSASIDLETGTYFTIASGPQVEMVDNVWDLPGMYANTHIPNPVDVVFDRNQFPRRRGKTRHVVLCVGGSALGKRFEFTRNLINRHCVTGIFVKSTRVAAIRNLVMDWNEVHLNEEEALSCDGIGDSETQVPVIANGRLTTVNNAADGRLVVSMAQMVRVSGGSTVLSPVSTRCSDVVGYVVGDLLTVTATISHTYALGAILKGEGVPDNTRIMERVSGTGGAGSTYRLNQFFALGSVGSPAQMRMGDWRNFMFVFSEGTGIDGTMADIYDFDESANTLTLDIIAPATDVSTGVYSWAGVHSGFFGGSFCHNKVTGHSESGLNVRGDYAVGISLYQNVFGMEVAHNEISGVANGITATGSGSLGAYHLLAYHNSIHDNVVALSTPTRANDEVPFGIAVQAILGGIAPRGNRVYNNILINAPLTLTRSEDNICEGNILKGTAKILRPNANPFYPEIPS